MHTYLHIHTHCLDQWLSAQRLAVSAGGRPYFTFFVMLLIREKHPLHIWDHTHTNVHSDIQIHTPGCHDEVYWSHHRSCQICGNRGLVCVFRYDVPTPSEKLYNNLESPSWHWLLSNLRCKQTEQRCCQIKAEIVVPLGRVKLPAWAGGAVFQIVWSR